jgi:hypothetical protein
VRPDGFVFSLTPDYSKQIRPDTITERYGRLAHRLGIDTISTRCTTIPRLDSLPPASSLVPSPAGSDHAGGGSTTLRVYPAWVAEADQQAAPLRHACRPCEVSGRPRRADLDDHRLTLAS